MEIASILACAKLCQLSTIKFVFEKKFKIETKIHSVCFATDYCQIFCQQLKRAN